MSAPMNVNLRQLRAFVAIGRLASFTQAAALLHTTQPALSARIRELEDALAVRLFDRNTRSVQLTRAGDDLLPVVEQVLADLGSVRRAGARRRDAQHGPRRGGRAPVGGLGAAAASRWRGFGAAIPASRSACATASRTACSSWCARARSTSA